MFDWTSRESGKQCLTSSKNAQNKNVPKRESPRRVPRSRRIFSDSSLNRIHGTAIFIYEIYHTTSSIHGPVSLPVSQILYAFASIHKQSQKLQECLEVYMLYISRSYIQILYWILFSLSHFGPCNKSSNSIFFFLLSQCTPQTFETQDWQSEFSSWWAFSQPLQKTYICS